MAYRVDDGIDTWPESIRAGRAAMGLYLLCGAWICRGIGNGTVDDAVVPVEVAAMYGTREWIARLVSVGLWEHVADGYADRRYFGLNPRPEKVARAREAKRKRQERWLEKARRAKDGSRDASPDESQDSAPPPPKKRGGRRAPARRNAIPLAEQCPIHRGEPATTCSGCRADDLAEGAA